MAVELALLEIQGALAIRLWSLAAGGGVLNDAVGIAHPVVIGPVDHNAGKAAHVSASALQVGHPGNGGLLQVKAEGQGFPVVGKLTGRNPDFPLHAHMAGLRPCDAIDGAAVFLFQLELQDPAQVRCDDVVARTEGTRCRGIAAGHFLDVYIEVAVE